MPFLDSLDIANRALDHLGQTHIDAPDEDSKKNTTLANLYDKLRPYELRRNVWVFSKRSVILRPISATTMLLDPRAWDSTITYQPGAIVKDDNDILWASQEPANLNNEPGVTSAWEQYFGPLSVELWDEDESYYAGELVYVEDDDRPGAFVIYRSLQNENEDVPGTADAWVSTTTYETGEVVSHSGSVWRSLIVVNTGHTPADAPAAYNPDVTYTVGQQVTAGDGFIYEAAGTTTDDDPTTDGGVNWTDTGDPAAWARVPTLQASATSWTPIFANMRPLNLIYPIGTGPRNQTGARNIFRLPAGYLRRATVNPKEFRSQNDWEITGQYVTSTEPVLLFGFAADMVTVREFDPMFCEGLAARMARDGCETITQSRGKLQDATTAYATYMTEARLVNAIENEYEEPPEDEYLAVRHDGWYQGNGGR